MKIGLQVVRFDWPGSPANIGSKLAEIGKTADAAGFDSIWVMDHFFQMDAPDMGLKPEEPMLDSYTALSYLAALVESGLEQTDGMALLEAKYPQYRTMPLAERPIIVITLNHIAFALLRR